MPEDLIFGDGEGGGSSQRALENLAREDLMDDMDLITHYRGVRAGVMYELWNTSDASLEFDI